MFDISIPFLPKHRKAWLVGGAVRDLLLGVQPADLDIISSENAAEYAQELAKNVNSKAIELGKPPLNIHRVTAKGRIFDITELNGSSIKQDLIKRDFTINALAWELPTGKLIDFSDGQSDLAQKSIRMVSKTIFQQDPIRLLRAFRLAGMLSFQIEKETAILIKKEAHLLKRVATERIQSELFKILKFPNSTPTINAMDASDLLQSIVPEVTELKKCRQNQFHEFNAFTHTMMALFALENILTRFDYILQLEENTNPNKNLIKQPELLKFSLLLHDIGKLETNTTGADGKPHFYGHAKVGATKADTIARRLALSNNQRNYITLIIGNHLTPSFLFSEYQSSTLNDRVIVRLFRKTKAFTPDLLLHSMADFLGKKCRDNSSILAQPFIIFIRDLLEKYCFSFVPIQKKPSLLSGRDLIQYFDLSPSPFFKIILEAVEEQRLTGQLISKTEALKWTKSYLKQLRGQYGS